MHLEIDQIEDFTRIDERLRFLIHGLRISQMQIMVSFL